MTMRKSLIKTLAFLTVAVLLLLTGCGDGIAQSEYDAVVAERDAAEADLAASEANLAASEAEVLTLQSEIEALEAEPEMTLPELAQAILTGEIDVGTEDGLALGQRFHNIHNVVLGLGCTACHKSEMTTLQEVFSAQDVSAAAPPVDRSGCVACHSVGGPATAFYGSES